MKPLAFIVVLIGALHAFLSAQSAQKPIVLWIDAHANVERLGTIGGIRSALDSARSAGFTEIVIDIKPIDGSVLYKSNYAPFLSEWKGVIRSPKFPYVETLIAEARARSMKAHLSLNVFAEGHGYYKKGRAYNEKRIRDWVVVMNTPDGLKSMMDADDELAVFVNPARREVCEMELNIIEEAVRKFHPDGIILDRCRYSGIATDFSNDSRWAFERFLGNEVRIWPGDILTVVVNSEGKRDYRRGQYFNKWIEWRASVIYNFIRDARDRIKSADSSVIFGDYVGAWYPPYFEVGVNWASKTYDPSLEYDWATPTYKNSGYAELLDVLMIGNYFYEVSVEELQQSDTTGKRTEAAMKQTREAWYSVEGSANIALAVTNHAVPVYGGLYVEQYKEKEHPEQFTKAMKLLLQKTQGLMIFDLVHLEAYGWWKFVREAVESK